MFCVERVSKTIRDKRINKNMTQGDLADILGVSFQAVSNWERGNSMPDISKLEDLCIALDISVEELLGMENKEASPVSQKNFKAKPEALKKRVKKLSFFEASSEENIGVFMKKEKLSFKELAKFAEHLDEDYLVSVIENEKGPITEVEGLFELIEYLPSSTVKNIVEKVIPEKLEDISEFIEDLDKEAEEAFAVRCIEEDKAYILINNAEFISDESLHLLVEYFIAKENPEALSKIYEYLDDADLCEIARILITSGANEEQIAAIYDYI